MTFAITPPDARMPHAPSPYPVRSQSQRVTSSSTNGAAMPASQRSMPWFTHAASVSPTIAMGSGGGVK